MDYTSSFLWVDGLNIVVPRPGEESRLFAFTRPFQPTVWLWIFVAMIFIVGGMTLFTWHYYCCGLVNEISDVNSDHQHHERIKSNGQNMLSYFSSSVIYVINTMTNQGCKEAFGRHSFRILVGFWLLGAMVLVNSYAGIVISSLTVPKMKPPIETLEDLAASKDVSLIIRHDVSIGEQILKATNGIYKILGDKVRSHPNQILGDPFRVNAMLETGKYGYPFVRAFNDWFVALQYKKDGHCRFHSSKTLSVPLGYYSWLVKKGNPNARIFSKGIMNLWETGLIFFWGNRAIGVARAGECFDGKRQKSEAKQISIRLADLTSAFVILGIGLGLALLCFSLEQIKSIKKFDLFNCKQ
ncbi:ionotropic receptor 93a-like [Daphnia carinata]|uniref:ionotropic receptor 93a-like n=1 Tax=Daphnia carinata TaxID=120202 RepID=UPI00257A0BBA|nr:ionotropic receptor 93a-like [Daphnia carinata]